VSTYRVYLHGHASAEVLVEAASATEANRKAKEAVPKVKGVSSWTPVATAKLNEAKGRANGT